MVLAMIAIVILPNFTCLASAAGTTKTAVLTISSVGTIVSTNTQSQAMIEWSISPNKILNVTNVAYAINVTKYIGCSAVSLVISVNDLSNIPTIASYVQQYQANGLIVWINIGSNRLLVPSDISSLCQLPITGVNVDIFGTYTEAQQESCIIALCTQAQSEGKQFSYYDGDGLSNVNATLAASYGMTVAAWYTGLWKPGTWHLPSVWAYECVYNETVTTIGTSNNWQTYGTVGSSIVEYTTPANIAYFYQSLQSHATPMPNTIVWWMTTCNHNPTQEQISAMKQITSEYLSQG